jgi:ADP-ribose pyrophosphatase YjhB (NUDIX family)
MAVRIQPKIVTMLVIQNSDGDILLQRRTKQPYIDTWTLPYGKLHIEDESLKAAAVREALDKISVSSAPVEHAGDCYIRVKNNGKAVTTTLAHVFRFDDDTIRTTDDVKWFRPHKISQLDLAPAVQEIVARTFFRDDFFFEEYEVDLHAST